MQYDDTPIATVQSGSTPESSYGGGQLEYSVDFEGNVTAYRYDNTTGYAKQIEEWFDADDGNGSLLNRTFTLGHMVISQHDATNGVLTFLQDGHGNTRVLLNATAALVQEFAFNAYGVTLNGTGLTSADSAKTPWLTPDGAYSVASKLYQNILRWREPGADRFASFDVPYAGNASDPISLHKYLYTHANPIMGTDPTGMFEFSLVGLLTSTAISSLVAVVARPIIQPAQSILYNSLFKSLVPVPIIQSLTSGGFPQFSGIALGFGVGGAAARGPFGANFAGGLDFVVPWNGIQGALQGNFSGLVPSVYATGEASAGFGRAKTGKVAFFKIGALFDTPNSDSYAGGYRSITIPLFRLPQQQRKNIRQKLREVPFNVASKIKSGRNTGVSGQIAQATTEAANALQQYDDTLQVAISWATSGTDLPPWFMPTVMLVD